MVCEGGAVDVAVEDLLPRPGPDPPGVATVEIGEATLLDKYGVSLYVNSSEEF